jgi:hypothetical protein
MTVVYWMFGALGALVFMYIAARLVAKAILRTLDERKNHE